MILILFLFDFFYLLKNNIMFLREKNHEESNMGCPYIYALW